MPQDPFESQSILPRHYVTDYREEPVNTKNDIKIE